MTDFKERLVNEVLDLTERLRKMEGFNGSEGFDELPEEHKILLQLQEDAMRSYRRILSHRIALIC